MQCRVGMWLGIGVDDGCIWVVAGAEIIIFVVVG